MSKERIVIIGNGMVGHRFIEFLVGSEQSDDFEIITFCEEPRYAYDRVHLSAFFSGSTAEDLSLVEDGFYDQHGVTVHLNDKAISIDRDNKTVKSAQGLEVSYDKLILATGSYPFVPPVPGKDREGCFVYRTIEDLEAMTAAGAKGKVGAVIGGGLLGLEAAKALKDMGLETHVIEFAPRLMAVQVDEAGGAVLSDKIEDIGVKVHTSKNTINITDGESTVNRMEFEDGESLNTDLIVFSAGIRPRDELALDCDLFVGSRGGIEINNQCQTSDPDIYAIGECALWNDQIFGLVAPGYSMAQVAVDHIINDLLQGNEKSSFTGADMSTKLKLMGVDVASFGDALGTTTGCRNYTYIDEPNGIYKKIVISNDGEHLLGGILLGEADAYGTLLQMMLNDIELPEHPDVLILPDRDGSAVGLGVDALPDSAQICSCNNVTKGDLNAAVQAGCTTVGALKSETNAGTGCGGCVALMTQVMNAEMENMGMDVNTDLCEHFPYTRQDLYNLIRVEEIKSFEDLIDKHGTGRGCDICKPTVGSILASCWNDYVLEKSHTGLQDTNDRYLGNMQKDGTYSVIPRIPGGEITPENLTILGNIGSKYGLYTKITGGQRIDFFGARLDQLPDIWQELVDAGFESGHAYAKSLRTVKSCVGSTWCRYGVDDSVGLAIELENRYKGLRSPHKIKFAVSGCTRECAEAQSKDIGVIATENGWNLYVCGNGGMKPRHADLFASDLDKETLIKYIDRVLMFYVRTGDRLQRTSTWMENMEGGLEYLQQVVIEDKLGLADQLEEEMSHVVDTFQCEWKTTIEDPEKVKRFRHFINSDKEDNNVVFVQERDQIRPATEEEKIEFRKVG